MSDGWTYQGVTIPWTGREELLRSTLAVAVPLNMQHLADLSPGRRAYTIECGRAAAEELIPAEGDTLQYGGGKPSRVAELFNVLARGLAALAQCPGGVEFAGMRWDAAR